jgi:23S rRNA (uracil1939-C5)-methyltransferase
LIVALNRRGDGVTEDGRVVRGALPGDVPGAAPICRWFGVCGGCAAQHMPPALYAAWKRDAAVAPLEAAGVKAEVGALVDAHGRGRRRATFHARVRSDGGVEVGFMRARAHEIVEIDACPLFAPELGDAPSVARAVAEAVKVLGKSLDIQATATLAGLDVDMRGSGALGAAETRKLIAVAERFDLARLSNHGVALIERRAPLVAFGVTRVAAPPGGFLQATEAGEETLASLARAALAGPGRVADLFCGAGAFAVRLAAEHAVYAVDGDPAAIAALRRAAVSGVEAAARDLFSHPLSAGELQRFDAVLVDPPRAGAERQSREIAASGVSRVVAISCNAESFARDARILQDGGYVCEGVTPIDQFRYSAHVEIFAAFRRGRTKRRRGVLS